MRPGVVELLVETTLGVVLIGWVRRLASARFHQLRAMPGRIEGRRFGRHENGGRRAAHLSVSESGAPLRSPLLGRVARLRERRVPSFRGRTGAPLPSRSDGRPDELSRARITLLKQAITIAGDSHAGASGEHSGFGNERGAAPLLVSGAPPASLLRTRHSSPERRVPPSRAGAPPFSCHLVRGREGGLGYGEGVSRAPARRRGTQRATPPWGLSLRSSVRRAG